jgi:hypothetical protein
MDTCLEMERKKKKKNKMGNTCSCHSTLNTELMQQRRKKWSLGTTTITIPTFHFIHICNAKACHLNIFFNVYGILTLKKCLLMLKIKHSTVGRCIRKGFTLTFNTKNHKHEVSNSSLHPKMYTKYNIFLLNCHNFQYTYF